MQETQKREQNAFKDLETAIHTSVTSHKDRLGTKIEKNLNIRKDYKKPPDLSHLVPVLEEYEKQNQTNHI